MAHNTDCFTTIGSGLKNVRKIRSGRLRGYLRGNTYLSGGNQVACETFKKLTGRFPTESYDRVVTAGKEIMYRGASDSKTGMPKLEIINTVQKSFEKITFIP